FEVMNRNQRPLCWNRCGDSVMTLNVMLRCVIHSGFSSRHSPGSPLLLATATSVDSVSLAGVAVEESSHRPGAFGSGITNGSRQAGLALSGDHQAHDGAIRLLHTGSANVRFQVMRSLDTAAPMRCVPCSWPGTSLRPV